MKYSLICFISLRNYVAGLTYYHILDMYRSIVFSLQILMSAVLITVYVIKMLVATIHKVVLLVIATPDFLVMELIAKVRIYLSLK